MADTKITGMTASTAPVSTDIIPVVVDPGGTPANRKITLANVITKAHGLSDGLAKVSAGVLTTAALTTASLPDSTNARYVTDAQSTVLGNTSGTNTGDNSANSSVHYVGTTSIAGNRASAAQSLTGITSIDGASATVTNATLTTALTVNTGTVTLTGNVANTSALTIGAGAVSVSGSNTGDQTDVSGTSATVTGAAQAAITSAVNLPWTGLKPGTAGNVPTFDAAGNPAVVATGTATHVLTSNGAGAAPTFQAAAGGGVTWAEVTGTTQAMATDTRYVANNAGLVTLTLPDTAALGKVVGVTGLGAGGWIIAQNASELIHFGNQVTTTGVGGSLASINRYDSVELVCVVANTEWSVIASQGSLTIV